MGSTQVTAEVHNTEDHRPQDHKVDLLTDQPSPHTDTHEDPLTDL